MILKNMGTKCTGTNVSNSVKVEFFLLRNPWVNVDFKEVGLDGFWPRI
jgi:hypothetical protein